MADGGARIGHWVSPESEREFRDLSVALWSLMWVPLLGELVGRDVYALDGIGDPGLSVQTAPITSRADLVAWLVDVLDALGLERVHLVGASYGGWIALSTARVAPERVITLTLLEPALTRVRPYFWIHGLGVLTALALSGPLRRHALRARSCP